MICRYLGNCKIYQQEKTLSISKSCRGGWWPRLGGSNSSLWHIYNQVEQATGCQKKALVIIQICMWDFRYFAALTSTSFWHPDDRLSWSVDTRWSPCRSKVQNCLDCTIPQITSSVHRQIQPSRNRSNHPPVSIQPCRACPMEPRVWYLR